MWGDLQLVGSSAARAWVGVASAYQRNCAAQPLTGVVIRKICGGQKLCAGVKFLRGA